MEKEEEDLFRINDKFSLETLEEHEEFLIDWLFYEVGEKGMLEAKDLYKLTLNNEKKNRFEQRFSKWEGKLEEKLFERKWKVEFRKGRFLMRVLAAAHSLAFIFLLFVFPLLSLFYAATAVLILTFSFMQHSYSEEGLLKKAHWEAAKDSFIQLSEEENRKGKLTESVFLYALAFGQKNAYLQLFPLKKAWDQPVKNEAFPLYFVSASGMITGFSLESINKINLMENAFYSVSPGAASDLDHLFPDSIGLD